MEAWPGGAGESPQHSELSSLEAPTAACLLLRGGAQSAVREPAGWTAQVGPSEQALALGEGPAPGPRGQQPGRVPNTCQAGVGGLMPQTGSASRRVTTQSQTAACSQTTEGTPVWRSQHRNRGDIVQGHAEGLWSQRAQAALPLELAQSPLGVLCASGRTTSGSVCDTLCLCPRITFQPGRDRPALEVGTSQEGPLTQGCTSWWALPSGMASLHPRETSRVQT